VFIGAYDHNVYCLDAETGREVWRLTTGCLVKAAPVFANVGGMPMVFAASSDRTFYGIDARTGAKVWNYETYSWTYTIGESLAGSPVVCDLRGRLVLIGTMWNGDRRPLRTIQTGELFALDARTGELIYRREVCSLPLTSPAVMQVKGRTMVAVGSDDGSIYACRAGNGETMWRYTTEHKIAATPVVCRVGGQPLIVVGNNWGMVACLSAANGRPIWRYKAGHEVLSTAAVAKAGDLGLVVFGANDRCVHAVDLKSGSKVWRFQTEKYVVASPAVANVRGRPMVFINSLDNRLYGLDLETGCEILRFTSGDMLWPYETRGASIWSSPSVMRRDSGFGLLLFPAHDGKLYAFTDSGEAATGADAVISAWTSSKAGGARPQSARTETPGHVAVPIVGTAILLAGLGMGLFMPVRTTAPDAAGKRNAQTRTTPG